MARRRRPWYHRTRRLALIVGVAVVGSMAAQYGAKCVRREPLRTDRTYRISHVVDGDTLVLDGRYTIRLIGVDTPEEFPSRKRERDSARSNLPERTIVEMGKAASRFTRRCCHGRVARVELDPHNRERGHRDIYGRHLAYVFLVSPDSAETKEIFLNRELVRRGYARRTHFRYRWQADFRRLEKYARRVKAGLWAQNDLP